METYHNTHIGNIEVTKFQKNLVVWKHESDKPPAPAVPGFQKNLVVWKLFPIGTFEGYWCTVSEELSSVETID